MAHQARLLSALLLSAVRWPICLQDGFLLRGCGGTFLARKINTPHILLSMRSKDIGLECHLEDQEIKMSYHVRSGPVHDSDAVVHLIQALDPPWDTHPQDA